ncbi:cation-translocating P-type ATPase [Mameliella sediminis]|uniref:cation-translocating P-type ATPase n=1 Tax=Mameliella sediminis TaxID=2836866 RepID=UPI001C48DEDD|nr:HAD-IC family P-type ATPase [Mameliella sediminis]MBV7395609.1 HAD-IC family P-type ATPase [Mameliella sediminis]
MTDGTAQGLTSQEAARLLHEVGPNQLAEQKPVSRWTILFRQFTSLLIVMLIVAAGIAAVLGETVDAVAILLVVLLNGILGFVQEWRTETALAALKNMLATEARVVRDGVQMMIDTRQIVPGDLVILDSGDKVPADLVLTSGMRLKVDESILTGESVPVDKAMGDRDVLLFMGSNVVAGRAEGIVRATGTRTEFGHIAELTASIDVGQTHLQAQLAGLARLLGGVAVGLAAMVLLAGLSVGRGLEEMFLTSIALAVAMVPEGLPAVVTITLALGASAMLRRQSLVRRLQAVETLGAATVICTDKTGTLTENAMTVTRLWTPGRAYDVTGTGYDPAGHVAVNGQRVRAGDDRRLAELVDVAMSCNHAELSHRDGRWHMVGDPTEGALVTLGYKAWFALPDPATRLAEIPFDADRKRMSVVMRRDAALIQMVKGAPEAVLDVCDRALIESGEVASLSADRRKAIEAEAARMASNGRRILGFARREVSDPLSGEESLIFVGLVGMIDPPRPEVKQAISLCHSAGIRVVMITGDAPLTGGAIAREIGLPVDHVLTGGDLDQMTDEALNQALERDTHFARTAPAHKMRLVEALQRRGNLVAMTGDGVNDAPALRQADIGIAMGQRGTDVAKDASDLVLLDDNFATIVGAVEEGRRQFANIQRFVRYLLASNAGEVVAIVVNLFLGGPLVFLATQILWMNLVTDGVTAVALGMEKASPDQMDQPPVPKDHPILDLAGLGMIACFGLYTGGVSLWLFYSHMPQGEDLARTMAFTAMVLFEKVSVFAFRSFRLPLSGIGYLSNRALLIAFVATMAMQVAAVYWPPLQQVLRTVPLDWGQLGLLGALALPLVIMPEIVKHIRRARSGGLSLSAR